MEAIAQRPNSIGKYRLIATLGQGGMARVYLALKRGPAGFNKLLVIKALREDILAGHEDFVSMFLDEARLAARLSHPNVVQTYEVGEEDGRYFIAMEYLEGQTYGAIRRRLGSHALPLEVHLRVLSETARGLHHAHELKGFDGEPLNVVHRDVSPQNIFVTYDGQVKLLDFGIAKMGDAEHLTQVGVVKGKAAYIAPEQVTGEGVDRRADVFALGAMLWEVLSGKPFGGGRAVNDITKIHNRVSGKEPSIREVAPHVPEALAEICERARALAARDRFPSAAAFADAIDGYLGELSLRPSASQLAALIETPFREERAKMRRRIDEQVSLAQSASSSWDTHTDHLPALDASQEASLSETGSGISTPIGSPAMSGVRDATDPSSAPQAVPATRPPGRSKVALVLVAVGAAALLALWPSEGPWGGSQETPTATPLATETPATAAEAPQERAQPQGEDTAREGPVAPTPPVIVLRIAVEPGDARVTLDGTPVEGLPGRLRLPGDGATHRLRAEADGYEPLDHLVVFDGDHEITLKLKRERRAERRAQPSKRTRLRAGEAAREPKRAAPAAPQPPPANKVTANAPKPTSPPARSAQPPPAANRRPEPGMDLSRRAPRSRTRKIYVDNPYQ